MIVYDFVCAAGHAFESWFGSSAAYERMAEEGALSCPVCGGGQVRKALSAPNIGRKQQETSSRREEVGDGAGSAGPSVAEISGPVASDETSANDCIKLRSERDVQIRDAISRIRSVVEEKCDYVGSNFAEEARKIHYGEVAARPIYGEASPGESDQLRDEGIEFASLPWLRDNA